MGERLAGIGLRLALLALAGACAHDVAWLGEQPAEPTAPAVPLPMTVAVSVRSFEADALAERALVERLADELRAARFFQGVMFPVPEGAHPLWELQLLARDSGSEPDANRWKAFAASFFPPAGLFLWLEDEYTLELDVLLVRDREIVRSYASEGRIQHRYQIRADRRALQAEAAELVVANTLRAALHALERDLPEIGRIDR